MGRYCGLGLEGAFTARYLDVRSCEEFGTIIGAIFPCEDRRGGGEHRRARQNGGDRLAPCPARPPVLAPAIRRREATRIRGDHSSIRITRG